MSDSNARPLFSQKAAAAEETNEEKQAARAERMKVLQSHCVGLMTPSIPPSALRVLPITRNKYMWRCCLRPSAECFLADTDSMPEQGVQAFKHASCSLLVPRSQADLAQAGL